MLLISVINSMSSIDLKAKTPIVQMMEGEIRCGLTTPVGTYHDGKAKESLTMGLEGRYNFKGTPWDCGLMINLSSACRSFSHLYDPGSDIWQNNRTLALAATGDYNMRQGTKINPFAGVAVGIGMNDEVGDRLFPESYTSFIFAPRIGVEILYHIRLMAQLNISRKGFNNLGLSLGLVLGGRPKKQIFTNIESKAK